MYLVIWSALEKQNRKLPKHHHLRHQPGEFLFLPFLWKFKKGESKKGKNTLFVFSLLVLPLLLCFLSRRML